MIPYFSPPQWDIGPLTLSPFGFLAAAGILVATQLVVHEAKRDGLDPRPLSDYALWGVLSGVVGGHFVHLFFYHPEELEQGGFLQIFKVWDGLSSFGGLLGAVIAAMIFFRHRKLDFHAYGDPLALAVATGWGIARLGCFAVHDHIGVPTDFPLAVNFPAPLGPRHDLGLYDAILLFALAGLIFVLRRKGALKHRLLPLLALLYAVGRFFEDFLRASDLGYVDARYFGLTPAQYFCFALVAYGIWGLLKLRPGEATTAKAGARRARSA